MYPRVTMKVEQYSRSPCTIKGVYLCYVKRLINIIKFCFVLLTANAQAETITEKSNDNNSQ